MIGRIWRQCAALCLLASVLPVLAATGTSDESKWHYELGDGLHFETEAFQFLFHTRVQALSRWKDPELGDTSASFDIARFKLNMSGVIYDDWAFTVQAELTDTESSPRDLEDAFFVYQRNPLAQVWVGQGKTPFGRQDIISTQFLQFVDRSLATMEFRHNDAATDNRDVGVALMGQNRDKTYNYAVGIYNGNGINKDEDDNTDYMAIARLLVTPFGEYELAETDVGRTKGVEREGRKSRLAVGLSARTAVTGTEAIEEELREVTAGLEVAYKVAGLNISGEFFTRSADVPLGVATDEIDTDGWYLQAGWLFRNHLEVAGRYSEVLRDTPDDDETEWGLALNYYFFGQGYKLQADYRELEFEGPPQTPEIDRKEFRAQLQFRF